LVGAEFKDQPIRCMIDLGIRVSALGEKFMEGCPWPRVEEQYDTIVNGEAVKVEGRTLIMFRLASGDCKEMMAAEVHITPDVDGLVLGMDWIHQNECSWNTKSGKVHTIDDIVFHADYDRDASLVDRVSPLPAALVAVGLVSAVELERPVALEQLLPVGICGIVEPEPEMPSSVGMVQGSPGFERDMADLLTSSSEVTSSQSESEEYEEYETEPSDSGGGELGQLDSPWESTSVPVHTTVTTQSEQSVGMADPALGSAGPTSVPPAGMSDDSDIIVEQIDEVILEPELPSSYEQGQPSPLYELSQGNAMAASATPVDQGSDAYDSDGMFTRDELIAAQMAEDAIRITVEYCGKGVPPDRNEIRTVPEEAKELLLQFESLLVRSDILYRRFQHRDGSTKYLQLILPTKMRREYMERIHADLGHFGQAKTCEAVARHVYFPGWRPCTKLIVRNCTICNKSHRRGKMPKHTALRPMREFRPK